MTMINQLPCAGGLRDRYLQTPIVFEPIVFRYGERLAI